jgi:hypothetical protein
MNPAIEHNPTSKVQSWTPTPSHTFVYGKILSIHVSYVVESIFRQHNVTLREWLKAVLQSALSLKVKLLLQLKNHTKSELNEEDV